MTVSDNILHGPQQPMELPPSIVSMGVTTFVENQIRNNISLYGDAVWMHDVTTGDQMTYSELLTGVTSLASALKKRGFQTKDTAILLSANFKEVFVIQLAVWKLGGSVCGLTPNMLSKKLEDRLATVQPKFVFTDKARASRVLEATEKYSSVRGIVVIDEEHHGCTSLKELLRDDGQDCPNQVDIDLNSMAWLVFSSGTTGVPKGVVHVYRSLLAVAVVSSKTKMPGKRLLMVNYMTNSVAMGLLLTGVVSHIEISFLSDLTVHNILGAIEQVKPHIASIFPCHIAWVCQQPNLSEIDTSSIQAIFTIGARVNRTYEKEIFEKLPTLRLLRNSYGLSEVGIISSNSFNFFDSTNVDRATALSSHILGSSGKLYPNCSVKILDQETGEILGANNPGEVCVKTPLMMKEYLNQPEETTKAIHDGWFHTGDKGYYDENGNLFIVGRYKEMIKYQSVQVIPSEIEKHIVKHPAVKDVAVVGLPDETDGELPQAFVVLRRGCSLTPDQLKDFVDEKLSREEKLRGGLYFVDKIPRNDSGKVVVQQLRALAVQQQHSYVENIIENFCYERTR